ncbi:MAG: 50S ribosomal protein L10 [Coriobacteriales bacterium]|jgi:large subunit ribosomal protein L10|nr:50S ribosomal protein L10 [Coriobacteriales bacterium]
MPNQAKRQQVERIKDEISAAEVIWVVDYRGLTVKATEELRGIIRAEGALLKVYKNSFTELALADLGYPSLGAVLEGPSAFVFANGDPVASAKALRTYAKSNPNLEIKGGLLNKSVVSADQVLAIASLPSREELIAKLLGTIKNPLSGIVQVLNGPTSQFVRTVNAIAEKAAA